MINLNIPEFKGFSKETLNLLRQNHAHNSRPWFEQHKDNYRQHVLLPLQSLVCDLTKTMLDIDPWFEIRPAVDKTISRIYRDTRFSKDKTLYRDNMWITFKRPAAAAAPDWKEAPAFFFEIFPTWYRYGMGYYNAPSATMQKFRSVIDANPKKFLKVVTFYNRDKLFKLEGERYKRKKQSAYPSEISEWYECKSFYLTCNKKIDRVLMSVKLLKELKIRFSVLKPLYQFLIRLNET
jgi:uncharacterized protein (TIGR02453 family)